MERERGGGGRNGGKVKEGVRTERGSDGGKWREREGRREGGMEAGERGGTDRER